MNSGFSMQGPECRDLSVHNFECVDVLGFGPEKMMCVCVKKKLSESYRLRLSPLATNPGYTFLKDKGILLVCSDCMNMML